MLVFLPVILFLIYYRTPWNMYLPLHLLVKAVPSPFVLPFFSPPPIHGAPCLDSEFFFFFFYRCDHPVPFVAFLIVFIFSPAWGFLS